MSLYAQISRAKHVTITCDRCVRGLMRRFVLVEGPYPELLAALNNPLSNASYHVTETKTPSIKVPVAPESILLLIKSSVDVL